MTDPSLSAALHDELHVWTADPREVPAQQLIENFLPLLDEEERARYARFRFERDRLHYLAAHALLRLALSRYCALPPQAWRFIRGAHGKPAVAAGLTASPLSFNLSHTEGLVACVISNGRECGIDVEQMRDMRDMHGVAKTVFSESEIACLLSLPEAEQRERFFSLWAVKEAYIKAIGLGFSAPVARISFDMDALKLLRGAEEEQAGDWFLHLSRPTPAHRLALACKSPAESLRVVARELELSA